MANALEFKPAQISLIRRTVAKDCSQNEFDLYIEMCKARGLNPLLRHCYAFVFSKNDADKRNMVIVVSIDGQRSIAERTGAYRPDDRAPRFENGAAKDPKANPQGLTSAEVTVYKHVHGEWFPVTAVAYWEECAPLKERWENDKPSGEFYLDPKKDGWKRMPRLMLAKCAEMAALRKAFPDDFAGLYGEAETDRAEVLDLTPTEAADEAERQDRLEKIGSRTPTLMIDWLDGKEIARVPVGQFMDKCLQFIHENEDAPFTIRAWTERNKHALREFWALQKGDALELKKKTEALIAQAENEAANAA